MHAKGIWGEGFFIEGFQGRPSIQLELIVCALEMRLRVGGKYRFKPCKVTRINKAKVPCLELLDEFDRFQIQHGCPQSTKELMCLAAW